MTRSVFVDTSALYALIVDGDDFHERAVELFEGLKAEDARLITTSYVLVETYALLHRRIGIEAVRDVRAGLVPLLDVVWVDEELHERALDRLVDRSAGGASPVDAVSFVAMRTRAIDHAFSFDRHFGDEGFAIL